MESNNLKIYMGIPLDAVISLERLTLVFKKLLRLTGGESIVIPTATPRTDHERQVIARCRSTITVAFRTEVLAVHGRLPWWQQSMGKTYREKMYGRTGTGE